MCSGENSFLGWFAAWVTLRYVILVVARYCAKILGAGIEIEGSLSPMFNHVVDCDTDDACTLRRNCPFRDELEEAIRLYKLAEEVLAGTHDACTSADNVIARAEELAFFIEMLEKLYKT